ncbi:hypothetical protein R5R35_013642 [Gryllus longicercus]|uniref:Cytochrome b-c1 complex subunit 2, mitochondrial n=1 Tax=Gryllus longicercus TaxID=2509291 RepID=A0AAN9VUS1_9ORTH
MASNTIKNPLLRTVANRSFSAQACAKPVPSANAEVKTTVLPNKLIVASVENNSPISRVSILFRAGSRYETHDNYGTSHVLRIAAGLGTKCYSQIGITRQIQQVGANISVTSDRELISYTLETTRNELENTFDILSNVAMQQAFKPWEISDNLSRIKYDLAALPPVIRSVDLLHKAAFRTALGNSIFCPKHSIGKISSETLQHFVRSHYLANRGAVVGVGVDHDRLLAYAQNLCIEDGESCDQSSTYKGGEIRVDTASSSANVAVAVEGASLKSTQEALAFAVLQYAVGVGPSVKWGSQNNTPLGKAVANAAKDDPCAVSALNASYSDSGLFGFVVSGAPNVAGQAVKAAVKQLRSGNVSEEDIRRGKAQLKASVLMAVESGAELVNEIGAQAVLLGNVTSGSNLACVIDQLKSSDVNAAAKKIASGKLSLAAVGNLTCVPYLDELK